MPDPTGTNGNISVDPQFVDNFAVDYHLAPGSPAIDAGSPTGAPTTDFDGTSRPVDGDGNGSAVVDIGAFEHAPDALPVVSGPIVSTTEGNSGTHNVTIAVKLSKPSSKVVSVEYVTIDDTAASTTAANPKGDYLDRFGTLVFQPGQVSKSVTVPIQGDQLDEINEEFWVVPYLPVHATLGDYPTIRILDDDPLPSLTAGIRSDRRGRLGRPRDDVPGQVVQALGSDGHRHLQRGGRDRATGHGLREEDRGRARSRPVRRCARSRSG